MINTDFVSAYAHHVDRLQSRLSPDDAFRQAIGGDFGTVGKLEHYLLRHLGLRDGHLVIDVGCGSGRLACQLAPFSDLRYIGCDVVGKLLDYARALTERPDWSFVQTEGTTIPAEADEADFIVFFSVFTHLLHEDTFRYFREARRCLKTGGQLVFSFLEFHVPCHWNIFIGSVDKAEPGQHLNQFISRDAIRAWAEHTGLVVSAIFDGDQAHFPIPEEVRWQSGAHMRTHGSLGQSVAVLTKR
jgi:SAM-dependent methyltransferase